MEKRRIGILGTGWIADMMARIMQLMDDLRREWGVHYPCDRW